MHFKAQERTLNPKDVKMENPYGSQAAYAAAAPGKTVTFFDIIAEFMDDDPEFAALFDALPPMSTPRFNCTAAKDEPIPVMTKQQLRALSRKHLYIMLYDLTEELRQAQEDKQNLLLAYRAGHTPGWQAF